MAKHLAGVACILGFWGSTYAAESKLASINELHEREIAAHATIDLEKPVTDAQFLKCVPIESHPYPKTWPQDLQERVFSLNALPDFMKCTPKKCAFNFMSNEVASLKNLKSAEDFKKAYLQFYEDRVKGKTGLDPQRTPFFIRSDSPATQFCAHNKLSQLLDSRPLKNHPFRLSHVHYNEKMRQTTRLTQAVSYSTPQGFCFAEALIFSDHYDLDRLEIWKLERLSKNASRIHLVVRNRLDFLSSWFRRLNKGALREELQKRSQFEVKKVQECLSQ